MRRVLLLLAVGVLAAWITGCAQDGGLCGGTFKSQAEFERVYGKQPPGAPSSTTSY